MPRLRSAARNSGRDGPVPLLPGVATASEIQAGVEAGFSCFKFFPAGGAGGIAALRALSGPFPELRFCATGGMTLESAQSYLDLPNVLSVGGSWFAPAQLVAKRDWYAIETLARDTVTKLAKRTPRWRNRAIAHRAT